MYLYKGMSGAHWKWLQIRDSTPSCFHTVSITSCPLGPCNRLVNQTQ